MRPPRGTSLAENDGEARLPVCDRRRRLPTTGVEGRGVLVKVLGVSVGDTDQELNPAAWGAAPGGHDFLIIGPRGPLYSREPVSATALSTITEPPAREGPRAAGR